MSNQGEPHESGSREVVMESLGLGMVSRVRRKLWALLVGISKYRHTAWDLKYAHADADALYEHLVDPQRGGFQKDHVCKLTNEDATEAAIRDGLYTFLQRPAREDFVVVFFACHGGPDPKRPENLYLYPHDTDPNRIAATAIRMDDVKRSLNQTNLLSERVVLFVDACHSGGIVTNARSVGVDTADAMKTFLSKMANTRPGMATLTAAEGGQVALEGPEWGGGHGVFTHFLLEGLGGGAALPEGTVTVGSLFDYVTGKVKDATSSKSPQHPVPHLDAASRQWPIAVLGDLVANERYRLGRALYAVGQRLNDPRRFDQAIVEHSTAMNQARHLGRTSPMARFEIARCQLAKGEHSAAVAELRAVVDEELDARSEGRISSPDLLADARFWSWASAFLAADRPAATKAAIAFVEAHGDDRRAALVKANPAPPVRRRALLVGVGEYSVVPSLRGPTNDVNAVQTMLREAGYLADDIRVLKEQAATREGILDALARLARSLTSDEEFVFYFAGQSLLGEQGKSSSSEILILPSGYDGTSETAITSKELHEALAALPAKHTLVIVDTCFGGGLVERVRDDRRYILLSGTDRKQSVIEREIEGLNHGDFTAALIAAVHKTGFSETAGKLLAKTTRLAHQTPVLVGDETLPLLPSFASSRITVALNLMLRPWLGDCSQERITQLIGSIPDAVFSALPEILIECGRMALDLRAYRLAVKLFEQVTEANDSCPAAHLGRAIARAHLQDYNVAEQIFASVGEGAEGTRHASVRAALDRLHRGRAGKAVMVGVSRISHDSEPVAYGALEDVRAMSRTLAELFHGKFEIEELLDAQATHDVVVERFRALVERSREAPCLFYFAGPGEISGGPGLRCFWQEDRQHIILLSELARMGALAKNLVCIIDAGWAPSASLPWAVRDTSRFIKHEIDRYVEPADWVSPAPMPSSRARSEPRFSQHRDVVLRNTQFAVRRAERARAVAHLGLGGVTIYNASILAHMTADGAEAGENVVEASKRSLVDQDTWVTHGVMTYALVSTLQNNGRQGGCRYEDIRRGVAKSLQWLQPVFVGSFLREQFMSNIVIEDEFERAARQLGFDQSIFDAVDLLDKRLERLESMMDGRSKQSQRRRTCLEQGIAYLAAGELDRAIQVLKEALRADGLNDPEVLAYLGRALAEQGGDPDAAVSYLQNARELWRDGEVPAYVSYYYCKALQDRMENRQREDSENLERALRTYSDLGSPLGHLKKTPAYTR